MITKSRVITLRGNIPVNEYRKIMTTYLSKCQMLQIEGCLRTTTDAPAPAIVPG